MTRLRAAGWALPLLATLLLAAGLASADAPAWYKCGCKAGNARCICPSLAAPRQLTREQTPQFILLTHDGAINSDSSSAMLAVTRSRKHPNGCPIAATMFAYSFDLDCNQALQVHKEGYEIASNGASNRSLLNMTKLQLHNELAGNRAALAKCGIPEKDVVGHRSPLLQTRAAVRETLQKEGFQYDSSVIELGGSATKAASLSFGMGKRVWPFTLDSGLPINCAALAPQQMCNNAERYAGLFEVPVWELNALGGTFRQDPGDPSPASISSTARPVDVLVANFEAAYNGNRAPFPIYIRTPWLRTGQHLRGLQLFAEYALKKPHVYFVTMRQLLAWMENPIPADQLTAENLGCGNPGGAGPTPTQALSRPKPPATPLIFSSPPSPAPVAQPPPSPPPAAPLSPPASPPPAAFPPPAASPSPPPPPPPPPPSPSPVAAGPAMPYSGVRMTFSFTGLSNASFWGQVAAPLRLLVLHDIVSAPETTFIASVAQVPAGTVTGPVALMRELPATRRALRQAPSGPRPQGAATAAAGAAGAAGVAGAVPAPAQRTPPALAPAAVPGGKRGTWLEVIMIAGGNDPLQMYYTAQSTLTEQELSTVLAQTGGQLAMPPIVVPFQDGRDLAVLRPTSPSPSPGASPPPPKALEPVVVAPAPAALAAGGGSSGSSSGGGGGTTSTASSSSSSSVPIGVIVGSAAGAVLALVAVASLIYWRTVVRPRQRATLAALADCSSASKDSPDGSDLAEAGSDAGSGPHMAAPSFTADLPLNAEQLPAAVAVAVASPATLAACAAADGAGAAAAEAGEAAATSAAAEQQPGSPTASLLGQQVPSPVPPATPEKAAPAADMLSATPVVPADQPATPPSPPAIAIGIPVLLPSVPQPDPLRAPPEPPGATAATQPAEAATGETAVATAAAAAVEAARASAAAAAAVEAVAAAETPADAASANTEAAPRPASQAAVAAQPAAEETPRQPAAIELAPQAPLPLPPPAAPAKPKPPRYFQPPAPLGSYATGGHVVGLSAADAVYATPDGYRRAALDQERTLHAPLQAERSPAGGFIVAPTVVGPFTPGTYSRTSSLPRGPGSVYSQSGRSQAGSFSGYPAVDRSWSGSQHYAASTASGASSGRHAGQPGAFSGTSSRSLPRSHAGSIAPPRSPSVSSNGPRRAGSSRSSALASPASPRSEASGSQRGD